MRKGNYLFEAKCIAEVRGVNSYSSIKAEIKKRGRNEKQILSSCS
jgi:hypothetical protein